MEAVQRVVRDGEIYAVKVIDQHSHGQQQADRPSIGLGGGVSRGQSFGRHICASVVEVGLVYSVRQGSGLIRFP